VFHLRPGVLIGGQFSPTLSVHSDGRSGMRAPRAEAGLHDHPPRQPKRGGRVLDLLPLPAEALGEADVAEPLVRPGFKEVSDDRSSPFGPDVAVKVEGLSVVKDNRNPAGDDLAADGTFWFRLGHGAHIGRRKIQGRRTRCNRYFDISPDDGDGEGESGR
jgi:hypothetical protein